MNGIGRLVRRKTIIPAGIVASLALVGAGLALSPCASHKGQAGANGRLGSTGASSAVAKTIKLTSQCPRPLDKVAPPIQIAPRRGPIPAVAGTPVRVVSTIAARLPLVASARVVTGAIPVSDEGKATRKAHVLEYDLRVSSFGGSAISEAIWQGSLLSGAVADEYCARGFGTIEEARGTLVAPNGMRRPVGGGLGNVFHDQVFDDVPVSIGATVTNAAARFGLRDVEVSTVQGLQQAIVIHTTTDTPARTVAELSRSGVDALLGGPPQRFEGVYLEVRDPSGKPLYVFESASRDGEGGGWLTPSLGSLGDIPVLPGTHRGPLTVPR